MEGDRFVCPCSIVVDQRYANAYLSRMRTTSYSDFRRKLAENMDRVSADQEPVLITRDRGKAAAVLMSLEDYASFERTRYLLRSPRNAQRLVEATQALDRGEGNVRELKD